MAIFAIIENEIVINVIVADNQEIANEVVATTLPNDIAIDLNDNELRVAIGWTYKDGKFIPPAIVESPLTIVKSPPVE